MSIFLMSRRRTDRRIVADRAVFDERHGTVALARVHDAFVRTAVCELEDLPRFLNLDPADIEFILRQECYANVSRHERFNRTLISAVAASRPVTAGIPRSWREALRAQGFLVAGRPSAIRWGARATLGLGQGLATYLLHLLRMVQPVERRRANGTHGRTAYLHTIAAENLPIGLPDLPATDVVSWLEQHTDLLDDIDIVASRVDAPVRVTRGGRAIVGGARPLAVPTGSRHALYFVWSGGAALAKALWRLLRGDWTSAFLAPMLIDAVLLRSTQGHGQAAIHLFNTSSFARRPLWTLFAPALGIRALCYHYSTQFINPLHKPHAPDPHAPDGRIADSTRLSWWDEQLAWDLNHAEILSSTVERPGKVRIAGPVSFVATQQRLQLKARGCIAVFDVTPVSASRRATFLNTYYTPELVEAFVLDIAEVAKEHGFHIAWKSKRVVDPRYHDNSYPLLQNRMRKQPETHIVDPSVSAESLITSSIAIVSIPFTSTAHIAHAAGKPSSFYDPSGAITNEHLGRHGLPLLSSRKALYAWMSNVVTATTISRQ